MESNIRSNTNELTKQLFDGREVRILGDRENPLFVANDIGSILGIKKIADTISDFDESKKVSAIIRSHGGNQETQLLTEKGLYSVLFTSRKKEAKIFQDWVFNVLKEIRLTGKYDIANDIKKRRLQELETSVSERDNIIAIQKAKITELSAVYKPIIEFPQIDIHKYNRKPCVYMILIATEGSISDFKFGWSGGIDNRMKNHYNVVKKLGFNPRIIRVWECRTLAIMHETELMIKNTGYFNDIKVAKYDQTEILSTDNIKPVIDTITKYVDDQNNHDSTFMRNEEVRLSHRTLELQIELIRVVAEYQKQSHELAQFVPAIMPAVSIPLTIPANLQLIPEYISPPSIIQSNVKIDHINDNIADIEESSITDIIVTKSAKKYVCERCGKRFSHQCRLTNHLNRKFKCKESKSTC